MRCFSRMLISNVHKSIIVMNSIDTRFSRNVFEAVEKTRSTCFSGSKTTRLRLVVLNPVKHSRSIFKHYLIKGNGYEGRQTPLLYVFVSIFGLYRAQTTKDFEMCSVEQLTDRNVPVKIFSRSVNVKTKDYARPGPFR